MINVLSYCPSGYLTPQSFNSLVGLWLYTGGKTSKWYACLPKGGYFRT
ncbi:hypothetical protein [Pasteurella phage PHB01]|uniref:Uncharacterized protein n=1 Tax=Pasteurella phage PHB01 TaxID=2006930 RepID=A0A218M4E2_9CAUD|nr:hypothetical protein HOR83_gp01 [Pasteurella phage PHB01]ASD51015.1 hypothetical protein [Pasteurella phage PHB01]